MLFLKQSLAHHCPQTLCNAYRMLGTWRIMKLVLIFLIFIHRNSHCNRRHFRTRFNFVYFVLWLKVRNFVAYENHGTYTYYIITQGKWHRHCRTKMCSVRESANARVRSFYTYEISAITVRNERKKKKKKKVALPVLWLIFLWLILWLLLLLSTFFVCCFGRGVFDIFIQQEGEDEPKKVS